MTPIAGPRGRSGKLRRPAPWGLREHSPARSPRPHVPAPDPPAPQVSPGCPPAVPFQENKVTVEDGWRARGAMDREERRRSGVGQAHRSLRRVSRGRPESPAVCSGAKGRPLV